MSILEVIHVRAAGIAIDALTRQIAETIQGVEDGEGGAVFRRHELETDLAVHLRRQGDAASVGKSALGLRLASALRAYGIVEHTVWIAA